MKAVSGDGKHNTNTQTTTYLCGLQKHFSSAEIKLTIASPSARFIIKKLHDVHQRMIQTKI